MLGLVTVDDADIKLTGDGRSLAAGDIDTAKSIFARQAKARAPLVRAVSNSLAAASDGTLSEDYFLDMLRSGFSEDRAHQQLNLAINWGRYAELYEFDADTGQLKLDHPPSADARANAGLKRGTLTSSLSLAPFPGGGARTGRAAQDELATERLHWPACTSTWTSEAAACLAVLMSASDRHRAVRVENPIKR